jgi:hypothetical protein
MNLSECGVAILPGVLGAAELVRVREAVWRGVEAGRQAGVQLTGFTRIDPNERNIRLYNLIGKDAVFRELVEHPVARAMSSICWGRRCDYPISPRTSPARLGIDGHALGSGLRGRVGRWR